MFRKILASLALASIVLASASASASASAAEPPVQKVIGAYYPGGSAELYPVSRIPADKLTHLFYAFARIDKGRCIASDDAAEHFAALAGLKRKHPHLRTIISIGGWTADGFSDAALTARSRKRFVTSGQHDPPRP